MYFWNRGTNYPVKNIRPALHSDALEHGQHGKQKIVKVGDAIVGTLPALSAKRAVEQAVAAVPGHSARCGLLFCKVTWRHRVKWTKSYQINSYLHSSRWRIPSFTLMMMDRKKRTSTLNGCTADRRWVLLLLSIYSGFKKPLTLSSTNCRFKSQAGSRTNRRDPLMVLVQHQEEGTWGTQLISIRPTIFPYRVMVGEPGAYPRCL